MGRERKVNLAHMETLSKRGLISKERLPSTDEVESNSNSNRASGSKSSALVSSRGIFHESDRRSKAVAAGVGAYHVIPMVYNRTESVPRIQFNGHTMTAHENEEMLEPVQDNLDGTRDHQHRTEENHSSLATDDIEEDVKESNIIWVRFGFGCLVVAPILFIIFVAVTLIVNSDTSTNESDRVNIFNSTQGDRDTVFNSTKLDEDFPTAAPTMGYTCNGDGSLHSEAKEVKRSERYQALKVVLELQLSEYEDKPLLIFDQLCGPYDLALTWLADQDNIRLAPSAKRGVYQRFASALLYFSTRMQSTALAAHSDQVVHPWLSKEHECLWFGISCNLRFKFITRIELPNLFLVGSIPDELPILIPQLTTLDLSQNQLTGMIPVLLYSSSNLEMNNLSGPIDVKNWTTTHLDLSSTKSSIFTNALLLAESPYSTEVLSLSDNDLSGTLPNVITPSCGKSLSNGDPNACSDVGVKMLISANFSVQYTLAFAEFLYLEHNKFNSTLPELIRHLTNLEELDLSSNKISGSLPEEIADMWKLKVLSLGINRISGTLSSHIGNLAQLEYLDLYSNYLTGHVPSDIGNLGNLQILHLGSNNFSQNIPVEFARLTNLVEVDMSNNELSGKVPLEVCKLRQDKLSYFTSDCKSGHLECPLVSCCSKCF
eukprot:scaffold31886_cov66-Attheya_sp.AAC.11